LKFNYQPNYYTAMTQVTESQMNEVHNMLAKGEFIEAMEKFYIDDVVLQEANETPKKGKQNVIEGEKEMLAGVGEFIRYEVHGKALNNDTTFYSATMEYVEKSGTHVKVEQTVVSKWENGKIISERFYHA